MPDLRKFCHSFLFLRIFPSENSWPLYPLPCQHWFESSKYGSYSKPMVKIQSNNQQKIHYFDTKMRWRLYGILCSRILWEKGISKSKFDILNKNDWIWKKIAKDSSNYPTCKFFEWLHPFVFKNINFQIKYLKNLKLDIFFWNFVKFWKLWDRHLWQNIFCLISALPFLFHRPLQGGTVQMFFNSSPCVVIHWS